jgi:hypothetical protein
VCGTLKENLQYQRVARLKSRWAIQRQIAFKGHAAGKLNTNDLIENFMGL